MVPHTELTILPDGKHIGLSYDEAVAGRMQAPIGAGPL